VQSFHDLKKFAVSKLTSPRLDEFAT